MIKQLTMLAALITAAFAVPASAQFTYQVQPYTSTELAATAIALSPTSLSSAIDNFDAASPRMGHPR